MIKNLALLILFLGSTFGISSPKIRREWYQYAKPSKSMDKSSKSSDRNSNNEWHVSSNKYDSYSKDNKWYSYGKRNDWSTDKNSKDSKSMNKNWRNNDWSSSKTKDSKSKSAQWRKDDKYTKIYRNEWYSSKDKSSDKTAVYYRNDWYSPQTKSSSKSKYYSYQWRQKDDKKSMDKKDSKDSKKYAGKSKDSKLMRTYNHWKSDSKQWQRNWYSASKSADSQAKYQRNNDQNELVLSAATVTGQSCQCILGICSGCSGGLSCCNSQCQQSLYDWAGFKYCPAVCRGGPFCGAGTCYGSGAESRNLYPRSSGVYCQSGCQCRSGSCEGGQCQ